MEPLLKAIRLAPAGTQLGLAAAINQLRPDQPELGQSAISNWLQRGRVPSERVLDVARAVGFGVTPHELRPDLYPNADDGLPADRRGNATTAPAAPPEVRDILDRLKAVTKEDEYRELVAEVSRLNLEGSVHARAELIAGAEEARRRFDAKPSQEAA